MANEDDKKPGVPEALKYTPDASNIPHPMARERMYATSTRQDSADHIPSPKGHQSRKLLFGSGDAVITIAPGDGQHYRLELLDNQGKAVLYPMMYDIKTVNGEDFASPELAKYFTFKVSIPEDVPDRAGVLLFFERMLHAAEHKTEKQVNFSLAKQEVNVRGVKATEYTFTPDLNVYDGIGEKDGVHLPHDIEDKFRQLIGAVTKHLNHHGYGQIERNGPSASR